MITPLAPMERMTIVALPPPSEVELLVKVCHVLLRLVLGGVCVADADEHGDHVGGRHLQALLHGVVLLVQGYAHGAGEPFRRGFSFVGNQYHLDAFGEDQWIDLLFFNRDLNCLMAVELIRGPFKTAYLGQLGGYLSVLGEFEKKPHENPAIGIVLCKDMNRPS